MSPEPEPVNPAHRDPDLLYWPQIKLWWEHHLSESDRLALIALSGMSVAEFSSREDGQLMALRYLLGMPDSPPYTVLMSG